MKGRIYPTKYGYQVRYGRKLCKHFKTVLEAERFLTGVRFKEDEGSFDIRDYQRSHPLGFATLAHQWLTLKEKTVKPNTLINLRSEVRRAVAFFGQVNIKSISSGQIEDFIYSDHRTASGKEIASKTRFDLASTLRQFFGWIGRREKITVPDFPKVSFDLAFRRIVDIDTQQRIIAELRRQTENINIKIYLGVKWLAENINVRPGELVQITEGQILLDQKIILVRKTKEITRNTKYIMLEDEDVEILRSMPKALPEVPFFRHDRRMGVKSGRQFGWKYLNRQVLKACRTLGVDGVTLYSITKHSTATALGELLTPEQIRRGGTGHATNKAFERYMLPDKREKLVVREAIKQLQSNQHVINISEKKKDANSSK